MLPDNISWYWKGAEFCLVVLLLLWGSYNLFVVTLSKLQSNLFLVTVWKLQSFCCYCVGSYNIFVVTVRKLQCNLFVVTVWKLQSFCCYCEEATILLLLLWRSYYLCLAVYFIVFTIGVAHWAYSVLFRCIVYCGQLKQWQWCYYHNQIMARNSPYLFHDGVE